MERLDHWPRSSPSSTRAPETDMSPPGLKPGPPRCEANTLAKSYSNSLCCCYSEPLTMLQDVDGVAVQSRVAGISATLLHPACQLGNCTLCILWPSPEVAHSPGQTVRTCGTAWKEIVFFSIFLWFCSIQWKDFWAAIQRRGSILAWIVILSVYGADIIAEVKLLISPFLRWSLDLKNQLLGF
jgi:hypothetical protein